MKEFVIGKNDAGQRLDRWLAKTLPLLPAPLAQKYIRLKRVKVNGRGSKRDVRLNVGAVLGEGGVQALLRLLNGAHGRGRRAK